MPGVVLSAPSQAINFQPHFQQQIVLKKPNVPYIPPEIVRTILVLLKDDKKTLAACALVNHTFNLHATPILYHTVSFTYSFNFTLFANSVNDESQRSRFIRHLDLSSFSTMGLQKSGAAISLQAVVTPDILIKILRFSTMLEAFSVSESLENSITFEVLKVLAFECKNLKSLDFCGISSKQFGSAMVSLANFMGPTKVIQHYDDDDVPIYSFQKANNIALPHIKRLSLHECSTVSEHSIIITLLAHSPNLTHLDLGGCSISDATLDFLATKTKAPQTLTHLSLARCKNISSEAIADLVAGCEQLEVLNLYGDRDIATAINEYDLVTILTSPSAKKLKSLDIGSSYITQHILYAIQENCTSLSHLGIAKAQIRSISNLNDFLRAMSNLQYIDLTEVSCITQLNIASVLNELQNNHHPLRTIEMSESLLSKLSTITINGWKTNESFNRRKYYAKPTAGEKPNRVHPRKLNMAGSGSEGISKIFQYYSFDI